MKGQRLLALLLVASMVICMMQIPVYATNETTEDAASRFTDMPDNWATKALINAVENGLLVGSGDKILPNDYLTRAQMAAIIVRAFNATTKADISGFVDVKPTDWFADSIAKAYQMGVMKGSNGRMNPTSYITRQEVCAVMARAFKLEPAEKLNNNTFTDADKISDWAKGEVYAVVNAGNIQGYNGILDPLGYVTRAQFAVIFDNFVKQYIRTPGVYETVADGNIMINVPGVTLKNVKINGDLIIGDGVGDGEVILDNVVVTGRMVVRGGGENSVIIRGASSVSRVIVSRVDGAVSVKVEGDADVEVIYIDDGSDDVNIEGTVGSIEIQASDITVTTRGAKIDNINISGQNSSLVIDKDTTVETIDVAGQAANTNMSVSGKVNKVTTQAPRTEITGSGAVGEVQVQSGADNSSIETPNTKISVSEGVPGVKGAGGTEIKPGETATNNSQGTGIQQPSTTGGGGGGGSGPSRIAVRAVKLDKEELLLEVGATDKLTATVEPANATNKNIIWTSSEEEVASVDPTGKVTAVASGEATITAKTEDGGFTATCTVRVVNDWSELADTTWYSDEIDSFTITSAEELAGLALLVNREDDRVTFAGKTITLESDIDLLGIEWVPIGFINEQVEISKADEYTRCANVFKGTFDGNNKTIYNLKVDKSEEKAVGLFGVVNMVDGATIKDVVIENAFINGFTGVGALAGMATSDSKWVSGIGHEARISGIEVSNSSISGLKYVGGVIGYSTVSIKESTVSNTEVAANYVTGIEDRISSGEAAGGIAGNLYDNFSISSCCVTDSNITSQTRAGGIAGSSRYSRDISGCTVENTTITLIEGTDGKAENEGYAGYVSGRAENAVVNASSGNTVTNCKAIIYGSETEIYHFCTPVSKVTVKQNEIIMLVGEKKNIEAAIEPENVSNKKVIYSSSNENVATVDRDGNVEALSPGNSTITAISAADPSKKATVSVIVHRIYNENSKTGYNSINDAINAAQPGDNVIKVSPGDYGTESIDIIQRDGVNITLEAAGDVVLSNQIKIDGSGRYYGNETLIIRGFTFDFSNVNADIITTCNIESTGYVYAHNIYVEDCMFVGNNQTVAVRASASGGHRNIQITDCIGRNLHSLAQLTNVNGVIVKNCSVSGGESGLNLQNSTEITIINSTVDGTNYGVRTGQGSGSNESTMVIANCNFKALYPVWLRIGSPETVIITGSTLTALEGGEPIKNDAGVNILEPSAYNENLDTYYNTLKEAISAARSGDTINIFKNCTIEGATANNKKLDFVGNSGKPSITFPQNGYITYYGCEFTFENLTLNCHPTNNYMGIQPDKLTANNCIINGKFWGYAKDIEFTGCIFNQSSDDYNIWTYGSNVTFNNCEFNCNGRSVLIYNEGATKGNPAKIIFNNCNFEASQKYDEKAAIEISTEHEGSFDIEITNCSATGFDTVTKKDGLVLSPGLANLKIINNGALKVRIDGELVCSIIPVKGISLNKTEINLSEGQTETLTVIVDPVDATYKDVTWTSSDTKVATVDENGLVTAVAAGEATITVTLVKGESKINATATVTVTNNDLPQDE